MPRHAFDLILHSIRSILFLLLVRRLGVAPPFAGPMFPCLFGQWTGAVQRVIVNYQHMHIG